MKNKFTAFVLVVIVVFLSVGALADSREAQLTRSYNSHGEVVAEKETAYNEQKAKFDKVRRSMDDKEKEFRDDWAEEQEAQDDARCELGKWKLLKLYNKNKTSKELRVVIKENCDELPRWFDDMDWVWNMMIGLNSDRDVPITEENNW